MVDDDSSTVSYNTYSHAFGILIPHDSGVTFTHQDGGMSCTQLDLEGTFLPLTRPTKRLDSPEWAPSPSHTNSPDVDLDESTIPETIESFRDWAHSIDRTFTGVNIRELQDEDIPETVESFAEWVEETLDLGRKGITDVDLTSEEIPDRDFESFPEWVQERGYFYNYDEYHYWLDQDAVDWYGHLDLIEEQRLWNYDPSGKMHQKYRDYDPTEKWDSLAEIWDEIDEKLPFTYETFDAWENMQDALKAGVDRDDIETPIPDGYPKHGAAFKWIQITGSKEDRHGRLRAEWAEDLTGEYVMLTYDNVD